MKPALRIILIFIYIGLASPLFSQEERTMAAERVNMAPKIDGILDDEAWQNAAVATDFMQFTPKQDTLSNDKTEVRFVYDNAGIYVAAKMYSDDPSAIVRQLGPRDRLRVTADRFGVLLDTYNDNQNAFFFHVTSAGVQADAKVSAGGNNEDENWDAVWQSAVTFTDEGWIAELMIPYSALRFPKTKQQDWGVNFVRRNSTSREESTWNKLDVTVDGFVQQSGLITGISKQLNLGPFEQAFDENRAFFTEGTELFNRNGLFYSRRVGQRPIDFYNVEDDLLVNEEIIENPANTKLLNATKVSGRTASGFGIGVFNAFSKKSEAIIRDTITNTSRAFQTQAFTNYNIISVDKNLKNNSNIGFINTNVMRADKGRDANVSGMSLRLRDKTNTWALENSFSYSQVFEIDEVSGNNDAERGFSNEIEVAKVSGKLNFGAFHGIESDTFNPNDLGLLFANNSHNMGVFANYNENEAGNTFQEYGGRFNVVRMALYQPNTEQGYEIQGNVYGTWKNFLTNWIFLQYRPTGVKDFYETRQDDFATYFKWPKNFTMATGFSSDFRKRLAIRGRAFYFTAYGHEDFKENGLRLSPRFRVNDKLNIEGEIDLTNRPRDFGYVDEVGSDIIFGERDRYQTMTGLEVNYLFDAEKRFSIEGRQVWDKGEYTGYNTLNNRGELDSNSTYSGTDDFNFSAFNIDANFNWRFAPGSDLDLSYRKSITDFQEDVRSGYFTNFSQTFNADTNDVLNLKISYYLDYNNAKNLFKNKRGRIQQ